MVRPQMLMFGCPDTSKKAKPVGKAKPTDSVERNMTPEDLKEFQDKHGAGCAETYQINKNLDVIEKNKKKSDYRVEIHRHVGEFSRD